MPFENRPASFNALITVAHDLSAGLGMSQRYQKILVSLTQATNSDAVALLRLRSGVLHPQAAVGFTPDVLGRSFTPSEHPRLEAIMASRAPLVFGGDDPRPDPFDGLIAGYDTGLSEVHSCMGCTLYDGRELLGVLTLDAIEPGRFDNVDIEALSALASLSAVAMRMAELVDALEHAAEVSGQVAQHLVTEELRRRGGQLLGRSEAIRSVRSEIDIVAGTDLPVLITGETGTGKELVARSVHARSGRAERPLVYINCAALPESIAESELFGHVRGAFTGASRDRKGKFELADGASLFLDEIGELPCAVQTKLLRVLQFGELQRVGSDRQQVVDVRIIAATNRNLEAEICAGNFRQDLYHRLNAYPIHIAALRARRDDIALLAGHLLDRARLKLGLGSLRLEPAAIRKLEQYDWPGNVRELDHVLTRAALRSSSRSQKRRVSIGADQIAVDCQGIEQPSNAEPAEFGWTRYEVERIGFAEAVKRFKRGLVNAALQKSNDNWSAASRLLGLDRGNLHRLAKRIGLPG